LFTCWIPLGQYHPLDGTLAVCVGSHMLKGYRQNVYGTETKTEMPPDFANIQAKAIWKSTTFYPGDMVVFDIRTVHASTANSSERFRISMDTRWQPSLCIPNHSRGHFNHFSLYSNDFPLQEFR